VKGRAFWLGVTGAVAVLAVWESTVRLLHLPAYMLPPVSEIVLTTVQLRAPLAADALVTAGESVGGFALGSVIGVGLAVVLVLIPMLRRVLVPLLVAVNSVPVVAYAPLALLWFGSGAVSKLVMVTFVVGFTVFVAALAGLERVDPAGVNLLRSFGAGRLGVLWRLRLPTALPLIVAGMRVATVRSVIVAIVTEMLGAYRGLGWTIFQAVLQIDFLRVWAAILVASAISLVFFAAVGAAGRRVVFWR
jgi:NitT/TauT family transport system permease protein